MSQENVEVVRRMFAYLVALAFAGVGAWLLLRDDGASAPGRPIESCNGIPALCDRPLNDVVFLATHNSYAGADVPGFRFPQQDAGIPAQLEDGIRGLWIDAYYGIPGHRVYTDTAKIDPKLNAKLREQLGPRFVAAATRVRSEISRPSGERPRIYLCHGFCELGAVDALDAFKEITRFLDRNPGEVLIIDIEDYVAPKDMVQLIERSGLARYAYRGPAGPPWPTLRQLIGSGQRVLIMAEHRGGRVAPWYWRTYSLFQETPFDFRRPSQMSCAPNRGSDDNSLFLINHWINSDPKPLKATARLVNSHRFLLRRARRCESERGLVPNAISVDFYREGDLFGVAQDLNRSAP